MGTWRIGFMSPGGASPFAIPRSPQVFVQLQRNARMPMSTDPPNHSPFGHHESAGQDNPFSDNPYASPDPQSAALGGPGTGVRPAAASQGMVKHVTVIAILMIVQGALETLMGLGLVAMGGLFPVMMQMEMQDVDPPPEMPPEAMSWILLVVYGGLGVLTLIAAGLHIVAGIRNYSFRGRVLGMVALGGGMVTMFTCYCAPTAVALGVYGLVTYLNPEVAQAFALRESGKTREEILAAYR
jgi:hypothetical protein